MERNNNKQMIRRTGKLLFLLVFLFLPSTMMAQDKEDMFNPVHASVTSQTSGYG